jgi:hypothetical protein
MGKSDPTPINAFDKLTKSESTDEDCRTSAKNTGLNQSSPRTETGEELLYMGEWCGMRGTVRYLTRKKRSCQAFLFCGPLLLLIFHQWRTLQDLSTCDTRKVCRWSVPNAVERKDLKYFFICPTFNRAMARFCSLSALVECAKHGCVSSPTMQNAFFLKS